MPEDVDVYTFLPFTDLLITDYSSIYFDYLLLNKKVVLFPFDFEDYLTGSRMFYFDYFKFMIGDYAYSFEELLTILKEETTSFTLNSRQKEILKLFWDDYSGESNKGLVQYLTKQIQLIG